MLSFKNNQNVQPLYDYYVETDLDSFDDQPVDYSKKYSDQESYDDCRRTKSILKTSELAPEVSQTVKQTCNDEVKVYCIEGTPLTISYASSLSDLREIGTNCAEEKADIKHTFPSVNNDCSPDSFDVDIKKEIESPQSKNEESLLSKDKDDIKEGKSVSFRNSTDISKASSPLMFSRSSSVESLNSFEQQSIVDDRSSVSVFSALTSGMISPSDLPDSPGDIMSPALTDKDVSLKIDVTKAESDNECSNIEFDEKDKIDPEETLINNIAEETSDHVQHTEMKVCIPVGSEDNEDVSQKLETSNDSLDEVFDNPNDKDSSISPQNEEPLSKSDDESDDDDILLQQCIELGMPSNSKENKCEVNVCQKLDYLQSSQSIPVSQIEVSKEKEPHNIVCAEKENALIYTKDLDTGKEDTINKICTSFTQIELKTDNGLKSDEESDDDDELLQHCIQLGMPEASSSKIIKGTEGCSQSVIPPSPTNYNSEKILKNQACAKSEDDLDADDIILQQCIQLGMPKNFPENKISTHLHKPVGCHTAPMKAHSSQVQLKSKTKPQQLNPPNRNSMPPSCTQYRIPHRVNDSNSVNAKLIAARQTSPVKKNCKNIPRKAYSLKSEIDSDGDENDPVLRHHRRQMGMSKESCEKKILHPGVFRKPEFDSSLFLFHPINDMRDNCPDGISDGDEDDAILEKCIRAGMPSPKITNDFQNRFHASQMRHTCQKQQIMNRPYMSNTSSESCKKFNPIRLPQNQPYAPIHSSGTWISNTSFIDVDSMRVYRTEDTPILSPSASISDLSSLSFNESFLNNSRNSDCSSDSDDDDELLRRCIRSGMPEAKRAVA